jgi:hypothetical protein
MSSRVGANTINSICVSALPFVLKLSISSTGFATMVGGIGSDGGGAIGVSKVTEFASNPELVAMSNIEGISLLVIAPTV